MENTRKKKILIIEDDINECRAFAEYINTRDDIELVGVTNSSYEGISYINNFTIDIVILDIELHLGKGSGIEFIESLNNANIKYRPMVVVVSGNLGEDTHNFLHRNKVEFIFYKGEEDYSQEKVIRHIMLIAPHINNENPKIVKTGDKIINVEELYKDKVASKINKLLDDFRNYGKFVWQTIHF